MLIQTLWQAQFDLFLIVWYLYSGIPLIITVTVFRTFPSIIDCHCYAIMHLHVSEIVFFFFHIKSSDDETPEEKDHFVAQLYKFMDDSNTPLNKSPVIAGRDVDLHKLFRVVRKLGGCNRVTNKSKWRSVTLRLKFPNNLSTFNQVKQVYKKCLLSYEAFHRTLGVTMLNHPRNAKKSRGRSLIRDKDRSTPVNSPRPEKDDDSDKKEVRHCYSSKLFE